MSDLASPASQEYLQERDADPLPVGAVWLMFSAHLVKSTDDPALVESIIYDATASLMDREEDISRRIHPRTLLRGDIDDPFLEDELRLIS